MSYWQESLRESVTTVDELVKRFGLATVEPEGVQRAIDGFNLRITPDLLNLILEVSGQRKKEKEAKVQTAKTMWVPSVNNLGTFGRWAFLEIDGSNLHKTKQEIRKLLKSGSA